MARVADVLCSGGCGRMCWRGTGSSEHPKCQECRRATPAPWKTRGKSLVMWSCQWCGVACERGPTKGQSPKYCGTRCAQRASIARKVELRGEFEITRARRLAIYERDDWACRICGDPTSREWSHDDLWSPTLDHIGPRSLSLIPDDSEANLRTAHWICNQLRGAAVRTDDEVRVLALARR